VAFSPKLLELSGLHCSDCCLSSQTAPESRGRCVGGIMAGLLSYCILVSVAPS